MNRQILAGLICVIATFILPTSAQKHFDRTDLEQAKFTERNKLQERNSRSVNNNTQRNQKLQRANSLKPTHADVRYGPHERNVFDLYLTKSTKPTPLVLYIHGGGFRSGDKRSLNSGDAKSYLDAGFMSMSIKNS